MDMGGHDEDNYGQVLTLDFPLEKADAQARENQQWDWSKTSEEALNVGSIIRLGGAEQLILSPWS